MVSDQASAIGVTAVPTPVTDFASDLWFFHKHFFAMESALTDRTRGGFIGSVDSKAMRKVNPDEDVVFVIQSAAASSGLILNMAGRMLIKLY